MSRLSEAQKDDAGWAGKRGMGETWTQFDALPFGVKRVFWTAPYEYTALPAYEAMLAGVDLRAAALKIARSMARDVKREALRLYGPAHPQAGDA